MKVKPNQYLTVIDRFILDSVQQHPQDLIEFVSEQTGMSPRRIVTLTNALIAAEYIVKGYALVHTSTAEPTPNPIPPTTITEDDVMFTPNPPRLGVVINVSELMDLDGDDK